MTKLTVQEYILYQEDRGLAEISINGQIKVLRIFFKFLKEEEIIGEDPTERIQLLKIEQRLKPIISVDDIERLLSVPDRKTFTGMRNFCMILVFYDTLVRLDELANIKLGDISLEGGSIRIFGKGRKERVVPFGAKTAKYLHKYLVKHRKLPTAITSSAPQKSIRSTIAMS